MLYVVIDAETGAQKRVSSVPLSLRDASEELITLSELTEEPRSDAVRWDASTRAYTVVEPEAEPGPTTRLTVL